MGQITTETIAMIRRAVDAGQAPPLTLWEYTQLAWLAERQLTAAPSPEASKPAELTPDALVVGHRYNWIGQPERLAYMGTRKYPGERRTWHQFEKVDAPGKVWCEVLDSDIPSFEASKAEQAEAPACQACGGPATRDVPSEATELPGPYCDECGPGATQPPASNAGERVHGFDRDELQDVATGLEDGYSGSVNVGADGERLESTNSYAARFIRAALATKPPAGEQKPVGELVGYQLSDGDGPDWHLRLFTKFAADEHVSAGGKVRALYAGPLPQDRQPLGPEDRRRIILGALSIGAAIDMVEATHGIFGAARARGEGEQG